jgi:hypothetical protein
MPPGQFSDAVDIAAPCGRTVVPTQGLATAPRAWETHVTGFLNAALHPVAPATAQAAGSHG